MSADLLWRLFLLLALIGGLVTLDRVLQARVRSRARSIAPPHDLAPVTRFDAAGRYYDPSEAAGGPTSQRRLADHSKDVDRIAWLLAELARPDTRALIGSGAVERLSTHYRAKLARLASPTPPMRPARSQLIGPSAPGLPFGAAIAAPIASTPVARPIVPATRAATPTPVASPMALPNPPVAPPEPRPRPWERLDSAVVLLYLGAFLVVAAGLVYSSYNWSNLPGWQKVALFLAATVGFAGGGFALLRFERVRPAAETFVGIGAILAPMNVLTARNLLGDRSLDPFATLELGSMLVAILYALFSYRPGGLVYRYATVVAASIALTALPPALGIAWGWGPALIAFATISAPDAPRVLRGRARRFARPVVDIGLVALPVAVGSTLVAALWDGQPWTAPASLAAASIAVGRFAIRRELDWLAWLWTGLVTAVLAATLLAGSRPPVDWTPAAIGMAALWLSLGERGPRLIRRAPNRDLLHAEVLALFAVAPIFAWSDQRWLAMTLAGTASTAGVAVLSRLRGEPLLSGLAALAATATYLSLANVVPNSLLNLPLVLTLIPCPLLLAVVAWWIGRGRRGPIGQRWAWPVWTIAAADALVVTLVALFGAIETGAQPNDLFILAGAGAAFGLAAFAAARASGRMAALPAAAGWIEIGALAALASLPAEFDRTLPAVALANALLVALFASPLLDRLVGRESVPATFRQVSAAVPGIAGGAALAIMLVLTTQYAFELRRPPANLAHPAIGWWWPYLGCFLLLAIGGFAAGRRVDSAAGDGADPWPDCLAIFANGMFGAAALLGLRMLYAEVTLSPAHWWLVIMAAGWLIVCLGSTWRARSTGFDRRFATWLTGLGALYAAPPLVLMLASTLSFALDLDRRAGGAPLPGWWPAYVLGFAVLIGSAYWLGRRIGERLMAPVVAAGVLGWEALLLRAAYGNSWLRLDPAIWLPIVATVTSLTALGGWRIVRPQTHAFDRALPRWLAGVSAVFGLPALISMVVLSAAYVVWLDEPSTVAAWGAASWWVVFLGFYAAAATALLLGGRSFAAGRNANRLAILTTAVLTITLAQAWRIIYGLLPLDRLDWLALGAPLAALVVAGRRLRTHGLSWRGAAVDPFLSSVGRSSAWVGGIVGAAALAGSTLLCLAFVLNRTEPVVAEESWWWRFALLYLLVAIVAWQYGRMNQHAEAAPITAGAALLAGWVGLRMATIDLTIWSIVGLGVAAGCCLLWTLSRRWSSDSPFVESLRRSMAVAGGAFAAVALPGNLALAVSGVANPWVETVLYALLTVGIFGAGLWERRPWLTYIAATALAISILFTVAAAELASVSAAYAFSALAWLFLGASFVLPTRGRLAGQRPIWSHTGLAFGLVTVLLGMTAAGAFDVGSSSYSRLTLAVTSLAGLLAVAAVALLPYRAILGYAAATIGLGALLMAIGATRPTNIQAFSIPLSGYLLGLAWTRRRQPPIFDALAIAGAALLMLPPFLLSFGAGGFVWALVCGGEGLLFVFLGLGIGRRAPLAAGIVAVTIVTLRQTVDYVNSLPTWAILALVGAALLILGTLSLIARDAFPRRMEATRERWGELR